jgi:hypothetical protein
VVLAVVVANRPVDLRLVAAQDAFLIISQNFHPSSFEEGEKFKHFQYGPAELQIPPLRSPGFPAELGGFGALHAPFPYRKVHTRHVQCSVAGNPGTLRSG